jgi:hypothetical protein
MDPRTIVRLQGLGKLKKSNDLIGNRTSDLLAFSIVPQPTTIPRAPNEYVRIAKILIKAVVDEVKFHLVRILICLVFGVRPNRNPNDSITKSNKTNVYVY